MTLRDRIAHVISSTSRVDECADAILSDPEIAALLEVAVRADKYRLVRYLVDDDPRVIDADDALVAALERLEEARRGG